MDGTICGWGLIGIRLNSPRGRARPTGVVLYEITILNHFLTSIDQGFDLVVTALEHTLFFKLYGMPLIVLWLLGGSAYLTLRMGFINVRGLGHGLAVLRGD